MPSDGSTVQPSASSLAAASAGSVFGQVSVLYHQKPGEPTLLHERVTEPPIGPAMMASTSVASMIALDDGVGRPSPNFFLKLAWL